MAKNSKDQIEQDEKKLLSELVKNSNRKHRDNIKTLWFLKTKNMQIH